MVFFPELDLIQLSQGESANDDVIQSRMPGTKAGCFSV